MPSAAVLCAIKKSGKKAREIRRVKRELAEQIALTGSARARSLELAQMYVQAEYRQVLARERGEA